MLRSWKIGRAFGIGIYIHSTFILLPIMLIGYAYAEGILYAVPFSLALLSAIFACVVLHELGHALMARYFGISTLDITLYPIGGVARLERLTERPGEELLVALAGPAVNVVIAALLTPFVVAGFMFGHLGAGSEMLLDQGSWAMLFQFLRTLWVANIGLVLFNLLPMFPMDGGRVLRALLWMRFSLVRATSVAVAVGRVITVAALLCLAFFNSPATGRPLLMENPMLLAIGVFVFVAGRQELAAIRYREAARRRSAIPVLTPLSSPDFLPVQGEMTERGFTGVTWDQRTGVCTQWQEGQPVSSFIIRPD